MSLAKHRGFEAVSKEIASKQGVSKDRADAILAASSRRASPAAKKKNPALKKVRGKVSTKSDRASDDEHEYRD
jgi:hypothetical protein